MDKIIIMSLCLFTGISSFAQQSVTFNNYLEKYPNEIGVFLNDYEQVEFKFDKEGNLLANAITETNQMILQSTAFNYFNTASVYDSYFKTITNIDAYTLVPATKGTTKKNYSRIVSKPSNSRSIFYNDVIEKEISFNNLEVGASIHVKTDFLLRDITMLTRFYFQSYIPVEHAQLKIVYPKGVDIGYYIAGGNPPEWLVIDSTETGKTKTITFTGKQIPAMKSYNNMPSGSYFMPHIIPYVKGYTHPKTKAYTHVLGTTADLYKHCYAFVSNINQTIGEDIKEKALALTKDAPTDLEKAKAIYKFVQTEVKYVAYEDSLGGFVPREASLVLKRKFGDCKDMSSLLRQLCKAVDLDARYVWIGTNSLPYSVKKTPFIGAFNHMIAAVKIQDQWYFMDGTDPITPFGFIPEGLQAQEAFIEKNEKEYDIVDLPIMNANQSLSVDTTFLQINLDKNVLTGKNDKHLFGYNATSFIINMKYTNEKDKKEFFEAYNKVGSNKYKQTDFSYEIPNKNDFLDIALHSKFELPDYINTTQDAIYVNMNIRKLLAAEFIDIKDDRTIPFENDFKRTFEEYIVLDVPNGYKVDYIPQTFQIANDFLKVEIAHKIDNNKVILNKKIIIDFLVMEAKDFSKYNTIIQQLATVYKDAIVLKKINK